MLPQVTLAFLLTLTFINAVPPPGYKKGPEKPDENPPRYRYQYAIQNEKGTGQGKSEARDGIFASGRYFVQGKNSSQNVEYVADDWGYHPYVEYSNVGPHSQTITQIALDAEAIKALRSKGTKMQIPDSVGQIRQRENNLLEAASTNQQNVGQRFQQPQQSVSVGSQHHNQYQQNQYEQQQNQYQQQQNQYQQRQNEYQKPNGYELRVQHHQQNGHQQQNQHQQQGQHQQGKQHRQQNQHEHSYFIQHSPKQTSSQFLKLQGLSSQQQHKEQLVDIGQQNLQQQQNIYVEQQQQQQLQEENLQQQQHQEQQTDVGEQNSQHQQNIYVQQQQQQQLQEENLQQQQHQEQQVDVGQRNLQQQDQNVYFQQQQDQHIDIQVQHPQQQYQDQQINAVGLQNPQQEQIIYLQQQQEQHVDIQEQNLQQQRNVAGLQNSQQEQHVYLQLQKNADVQKIVQQQADQENARYLQQQQQANANQNLNQQPTIILLQQVPENPKVLIPIQQQQHFVENAEQHQQTSEQSNAAPLEQQNTFYLQEIQVDQNQNQKEQNILIPQKLVTNVQPLKEQKVPSVQQQQFEESIAHLAQAIKQSSAALLQQQNSLSLQQIKTDQSTNQAEQKILVPQQLAVNAARHTENAGGAVSLEQQNSFQLQQIGQNLNRGLSTTSIPNLEEQANILLQGGAVVLQDLHGFSGHTRNLFNFGTSSGLQHQEQSPLIVLQDQTLNGNQQQNPTQIQENLSTKSFKANANKNLNKSRYETAALYENSGNTLVSSQNTLLNTKVNTGYDKSVLKHEHPGGYGSKLNVRVTHNSRPLQILQSLRNLVSGQDVININQAINQNLESAKLERTTAATAIVSEYGPSSPQSANSFSVGYENANTAIASSTEASAVSSTPSSTENSQSLSNQPIVVADLENYREINLQSSTQSLLDVEEEKKEDSVTESTVDITPRPVSSKFLAPITAAVQLQRHNLEEESKNGLDNFVVDIQKSIPYYLGKIEYYDQAKESRAKEINITASATQNIQLGGFLQHPIRERQRPKAKGLVKKESEKFSQTLIPPHEENDQVQAPGQLQPQIQLLSTRDKAVPVTELAVHPTDAIQPTKVLEKSVEVTKYIDRPYPVEVHLPVHVDRPVPVPVRVEVEKIVKKTVPVPQIVEKQIHIPHHVEKKVEVPVQVTKYVDRPYPVPVAVPKPVPYPVQVERVVEKVVPQPYPVEVRVPIQVPVHVPVPHPVQVTVEKKVPVPQYIEKPVPVEKIVEKPVPQYVPKPYPVKVPVPVAQAFYIPVEVPKPYPVEVTKYVNKPYAVPKPYPVQLTQTIEVPIAQPVPVEIRVPHPVPVEVPKFINRVIPVYIDGKSSVNNNQQTNKYLSTNSQENLAYAASYQSPCIDLRLIGIQKPYCPINNNNYIGLVPPKPPQDSQNATNAEKYRKPRQNFENNVRLEYGFMPPLIPSLEIDEDGNPVEKHTK